MARSHKPNPPPKRKNQLRCRYSHSAGHFQHPKAVCKRASDPSVCDQSTIEDKVLRCLAQLKNFVCRSTSYSPSRMAHIKKAASHGVHRKEHYKTHSRNPLLSKRKQQIARKLFNVIDDALEYGETNEILKRSNPSATRFKRTLRRRDPDAMNKAEYPLASKRPRLDRPNKHRDEHPRRRENSASEYT